MRRYALILLVLILLLLNSLMQHAAEATPFTHPDLWELRFALPAGVVGAALFLVSLGLGAMFWRGALSVSGGRGWAPRAFWQRLSAAGLWCGWLPLLCAQTYTISSSQLPMGAPSPWLVGAFVALIICRMAEGLVGQKWWGMGFISALVAAAAAILCGQELCPAVPLCPLVLGLAAAPALRLLTEKLHMLQLVWVQMASFTFCAYVAAFGYLLLWYTPSESQNAASWGLWLGGIFLVLALGLVMLEPLRRSSFGPRAFAAAGLVAGVVWLWLELAPAQGVLPAQQLASMGIYAGTLVLLAIPTALLMHDHKRI